jgi:alkaline phosphatase
MHSIAMSSYLLRVVSVLIIWLQTDAAIADKGGSVIFIHPDGAGLNAWNACRLLIAGPNGKLAWDRLSRIGIYRGHCYDNPTATSQSGATTHAYGVRVSANSYGMNGQEPVKALSGFNGSIMQEALKQGKAAGIINSGHIGEPGTGVFLASSKARADVEKIAAQIITSGAEVILCGGEMYLIPEGQSGFHGVGVRSDGKDLVAQAKELGYTVVYNSEQLTNLDLATVDKLLGLFAAKDTYNDMSEEELKAAGLPMYKEAAPDVADMMSAALTILSRRENGFILVAEEEGSDNFGNKNNAAGVMEALRRADRAYAEALRFLEQNPSTLILTTADSDAGGLQVISHGFSDGQTLLPEGQLPARMDNGAPLDGRSGCFSEPFMSAPDQNGQRFPFGISWASYIDVPGAILVRAAGLNCDKLAGDIDNSDIYRLMYRTLFGKEL